MRLYRLNNPHYPWHATAEELAASFWAGSRQAAWLTRPGGDPSRETAGAVASWLRDPLAHQSSWDDRDGFNEVVAAVQASWPLVTSTGRMLSDADLEELATEAERGYEVKDGELTGRLAPDEP